MTALSAEQVTVLQERHDQGDRLDPDEIDSLFETIACLQAQAGRAEEQRDGHESRAEAFEGAWNHAQRQIMEFEREERIMRADAIRSLIYQIPLKTEAGDLTEKGLNLWLLERAREVERGV